MLVLTRHGINKPPSLEENAAQSALQVFTSTFVTPLVIIALSNLLRFREGLKIWHMLTVTLLANRKDTLLWGPDLGFSFPAAVCG